MSLSQPEAERTDLLSPQPKSRSAFTFVLVAVLWLGFGLGLRQAWASCTAYFVANNITFLNGENAQNATNSNYDYYQYCSTYNASAGKYVKLTAITWSSVAVETDQYKQNWICSYNGRNDTYFGLNCSWGSNITAFWESEPQQQLQSVLILR